MISQGRRRAARLFTVAGYNMDMAWEDYRAVREARDRLRFSPVQYILVGWYYNRLVRFHLRHWRVSVHRFQMAERHYKEVMNDGTEWESRMDLASRLN